LLNGVPLAIAYNEFCAPTLAEAVEQLIAAGATSVTVVPTMLTPGGVHSEIEIPETLERLRSRHPQHELRYAWPVDLALVARMLAEQLSRTTSRPVPPPAGA
jgi:sirohydrochlorin cobaltochelatase